MEPQKETQKILIIEDDRALRTILVDRLREDGYQVFEATNGEAGLQMAIENRPDLVLLDIIMPKMDGIEMLAELRKDEWGKDANVIMLTNLSADDQKVEAEKQGVEDYLVKSDWDIEGIVSCIKEKIAGY